MTEGNERETGRDDGHAPAGDDDRKADWERRRRLAEVFGDVLPSTTRDERDPEAPRGRGEDAGERWLKDQVPPHHG